MSIAGEEADDDDDHDVGPNLPKDDRHRFQNLDAPALRSWPSSAKRQGSDDDMSTDEVPLTQIKVKTDLAVGETRRDQRDDDEDMERKYGVTRW